MSTQAMLVKGAEAMLAARRVPMKWQSVCISCHAGHQLACESAVFIAAVVAGTPRKLTKKRKSVVLSDDEEDGAAESESNDSGSDWGKEGAAEAAGAQLAFTPQARMH